MAGEASNAANTRDNRMISGLVPTTVVTFNFMVLLYMFFADCRRFFSQIVADFSRRLSQIKIRRWSQKKSIYICVNQRFKKSAIICEKLNLREIPSARNICEKKNL
jgi:hypothetical protein